MSVVVVAGSRSPTRWWECLLVLSCVEYLLGKWLLFGSEVGSLLSGEFSCVRL